ncbi:hypothetical protein [Croceiramulus getboli]|nr:hypothetical protein P8624_00855 [Flavobacteriaceae bacterium YJPT1-3]
MKAWPPAFFLLVLMTACSTPKTLQKSFPTRIVDLHAETYQSGVQEMGKTVSVHFTTAEALPAKTSLTKAIYQGNEAQIEKQSDQNYKITFNLPYNEKGASQKQDPLKELPFSLDPNEILLIYIEQGKTKYYKARLDPKNLSSDKPM